MNNGLKQQLLGTLYKSNSSKPEKPEQDKHDYFADRMNEPWPEALQSGQQCIGCQWCAADRSELVKGHQLKTCQVFNDRAAVTSKSDSIMLSRVTCPYFQKAGEAT